MADGVLSRHLLSVGEANEPPLVGVWSIVLGIAGCVLLVLMLALCACKDEKEKIEHEEEPETDKKQSFKKKSERKSKGESSTDVVVEFENEDNQRHSNGTAVRDSVESGRVKIHDQRALPAIPATNQVSASQTEDEEDEDSTYDIIPKSKQGANAQISNGGARSKVVADIPSPAGNVYEAVEGEVSTPDSDEKNDKIKGTNHAYARVGRGTSKVVEDGNRDEKTTPSHIRVQMLGQAPQASLETLEDGSYSSISPIPPVPDKNFDSAAGGEIAGGSRRSGEQGAGDASIVDTTIPPAEAGASPIDMTSDSNKNKKEPPYSRVTARESLANLRERQAKEMQAVEDNSAIDAMYESVNYEQISVPNTSLSTQTGDRNSLTSDLYAEIQGSTTGYNSTRSSTYARVNETGASGGAPTPPSVELLRKQLASSGGDVADPGYSVIQRPRPVSAHASTYANPSNELRPEDAGAAGGPLYAIVNKTVKTRQSVHVSQGVESTLPAGVAGPLGDIYAEVKKPSKIYNNNGNIKITNARKPNQAVHLRKNENSSGSLDPGYQTIGSVGKTDPCYDNIEDTQIDPNYEQVDIGAAGKTNGTGGGKEQNGGASNGSGGMVHISDHVVKENFWQPREHVYQEINEAKQDKSKPDDSFSTAL